VRIWVKEAESLPDYNIEIMYGANGEREDLLTAAMILDLSTSAGEQTAIFRNVRQI